MATVSQQVENGDVTVVMSNNEVAKVRQALGQALTDQHQDFKNWLVTLQADWDNIVTKVGNTNTFVTDAEDAKQFQDLLGQLRQDGPLDADLVALDNLLHSLWNVRRDPSAWPLVL